MAESPTILVIGPRWVGDMVMSQCLFSALKEQHPNAAIDVLAPGWAAPLVKRMPEIRYQIDFPLMPGALEFGSRRRFGRLLRGRYDIAYVLPGSWKSALIPFFARIPRRVGHLREMRYGLLTDIVPLPDALKRRTARAYFSLAQGGTFRAPQFIVDADNQAALLDRFGLASGKFVALMPGAEFGPAKRWPGEYYAELARAMMAKGLGVALLGSKKDASVTGEIAALAPGAVDIAGKTKLEDTIDLIAAAKLAVSNDSGLMHVAAAVGTPIVAVYGSTSPENTPPLSDRSELIWLHLSCSPCHSKTCPLGHLNCLKTLDVARVEAAADRLLEVAAAA
ncbi:MULTISPECIES: lipopolysaccharide heptosyltransferase II [unclassified Mesorhizobium]|uniref:lipopolysaccharide heptosyltransferase II n=1 Tax=unclassified Mesorhizobium TaxID=325217 RepID=UPI000BAEDCF2|nr:MULTISPECIES: lipopolysaccharide heptosyltransferase II [unclassified Mesorhizobium]TGT57381.1 lipopolysaccharide heptosyltransferase II [Mesorhizobium sp. M00.F.Ca.ET.170.01.1.1]AZO11887.1 lipopolysaccharide heptosyltransferase II [Mesorhizobium sp. M3A.F.Ca.ET.080.04.2.1]PBB86218.1 lipopolysaccharide heptosyltransferase II [Mesorhizobium sp. WSM3876]RWB73168.1 MAG: lipopolysaccharide heptosyltransferase II [Mesorhizobium sp.]RWB82693.1 MAG: lipopolysaccharide heptosyltransferase II [Mesor